MYTTEEKLKLANKKLLFIEAWLNTQGEMLEEKYSDKKSANMHYMAAELVQNIRYESYEDFESMYNEVMQFDRLKSYK